MRGWVIALIGASTVLTIVSLVFLCVPGFFADPSLSTTYRLIQINKPIFGLAVAGTVIAMIMGGVMFFYYIGDEFDEHEYKFVPLIIISALLFLTGLLVILLPGNAGVSALFESKTSEVQGVEVVFNWIGNAFLILRTLGIAGFIVATVLSAIDLLGYY